MGDPPSSRGAFQDSEQLSGVMSDTSRGPWGGDGLSGEKSVKNPLISIEKVFVSINIMHGIIYPQVVSY